MDLEFPEQLVDATRHSFKCNADEKSRRRLWTLSRLSYGIHSALAQRLSFDICHLVAEHLQAVYAVVAARAVLQPARSYEFTMDKEIWCERVSFEGIEYLSRLSNYRTQLGMERIFHPSMLKTSNRLLIQENHLGITQIVFSPSDNSAAFEYKPNSVCRVFDLEAENLTITGKFDVSQPRHRVK